MAQSTLNSKSGQTRSLKRKNEEKQVPIRAKSQKITPTILDPKKTTNHASQTKRLAEKPARKSASNAEPKPKSKPKPKVIINNAPTTPLNIYVFGDNSQGQLGLGPDVPGGSIRRPRLNPLLPKESVGVVQVAAGGMHCAALTCDNKILTWGVNDLGALGRSTEWDGGWVNMDDKKSDDDSEDEENAVNPKEATPTAIDASSFPPETTFTSVVAGDSATFAVTDEGLVYGWGTFRGSDGSTIFAPGVTVQKNPTLIEGLKKITKIVTGNNFALALTSQGGVISWGFGDQCQLGRRTNRTAVFHRLEKAAGLSKDVIDIAAGSYHSFAIHKDRHVYAWGLNSFCQTGIDEKEGEEFENITRPTAVPSLVGKPGRVICTGGGNQHSIAVTDQGACFTWGRVNTCALGLDIQTLPERDVVKDPRGKPGTLKGPVLQIPNLDVISADAGIDHCIAVTRDGRAYGWGFSSSYQTGQGTDQDIEHASLIENTAIRGKRMTWAGCGGHFSILAGEGD